MSRLDYRGITAEPGPECVCGAELKAVPLPADLAKLAGRDSIWIHEENRDTRCYPDDPGAQAATAEPYASLS